MRFEFEQEFEWDENKNKLNKVNHGISFETAKLVFNDPFLYQEYDYIHSITEDRYIAIGIIAGKMMTLFVSYTERGDVIRLISAREAEPFERRKYYDHKNKSGF